MCHAPIHPLDPPLIHLLKRGFRVGVGSIKISTRIPFRSVLVISPTFQKAPNQRFYTHTRAIPSASSACRPDLLSCGGANRNQTCPKTDRAMTFV